MDRLNRQISQNLSGVRVIRAFARKETEQRHVDKASDDLGDIYIRVSNVSAINAFNHFDYECWNFIFTLF